MTSGELLNPLPSNAASSSVGNSSAPGNESTSQLKIASSNIINNSQPSSSEMLHFPNYYANRRAPILPSIGGVQITPKTPDLSESAYYTCVCEKSLLKLHRWNQKLTRSDAVNVYNLKNAQECVMATHKFLTMLAILRVAIENEWIEQDLVSSAHQDELALRDPSELGQMVLPSGILGKQKPLSSAFVIRKISISTMFKVGGDEIPVRFCMHCKSAIFNRGWTLLDELNDAPLHPNQGHICASCYCQGIEKKKAVMTERMSIHDLISTYRNGIFNYNKVLRELFRGLDDGISQINLDFFNVSQNGMLIDDFLFTDPRPADGRSSTTISYHLYMRSNKYETYCYQCKERVNPAKLVCCPNYGNHASYEKIDKNNSCLFCFRCTFSCYNQRPLEILVDRTWKCFVCNGTFTPGAGSSNIELSSRIDVDSIPYVNKAPSNSSVSPRSSNRESAVILPPIVSPSRQANDNTSQNPSKRMRYSSRFRDSNESLTSISAKAYEFEQKYLDELSNSRKLAAQLKQLSQEMQEMQILLMKLENYDTVKQNYEKSQLEISELKSKVQFYERQQEQTVTVIQNLKKIAKAVATQAAQLGMIQENDS